MKFAILASSAAACFCLGLTTPLIAAEATATGTVKQPTASEKTVAVVKPAEKCLSDLRAFDAQMAKGGYWLGASDYGYGYPMGGYGYGYPMGGYPGAAAYQNGRPGYEVRNLIASANILARHGEQQECENLLTTSRAIYKLYVANLHNGGVPAADVPGWQKQQIAAAQPVTSKTTSFRSDELVGAEVRNAQGEALGSVDDIVMSPKSGQIAYLVIVRGGIFGFDEKYVPVPWADFKIAPNVNLLVLDTNKVALDAAPRVKNDQFTGAGHFEQESQKVDDYWKTHLSINDGNGSKG